MRQLPAKVGMECAKLMLVGVNIMFMIIGFLLISIGATIKTVYIELDTFLIHQYYNMSKAAIAIGIIIILISIFGCLAALKRSVCMMNIYALVLSCVFIVNICMSITAFLLVHKVEHAVERNMFASLRRLAPDTPSIWEKTQSRFHCCGVHGPEDWKSDGSYQDFLNLTHVPIENGTSTSSFLVPLSCCADRNCEDQYRVFKHGCLGVMVCLVSECAFLLGTGTLCVALIEFLGVIFAILLAKSVRKLKTQIEVDKTLRIQQLYEQLDNSKRTENAGPILYTPTSSEA